MSPTPQWVVPDGQRDAGSMLESCAAAAADARAPLVTEVVVQMTHGKLDSTATATGELELATLLAVGRADAVMRSPFQCFVRLGQRPKCQGPVVTGAW